MPHLLGWAAACVRWPNLIHGSTSLKKCCQCSKSFPRSAFSKSQRRLSSGSSRCRECAAQPRSRSTKIPRRALQTEYGRHSRVGMIQDIIEGFPVSGSRRRRSQLELFNAVLQTLLPDDPRVTHALCNTWTLRTMSRKCAERVKAEADHGVTGSGRHKYHAGHIVALGGNVDGLHKLVACGAESLFTKSGQQWPPCFLATMNGHTAFLRELHMMCPDCIRQVTGDGRSVAHIAASLGHADILRLLSELSAGDLLQNSRSMLLDDHSDSPDWGFPIAYALRADHVECVQTLVECCGEEVLSIEFLLENLFVIYSCTYGSQTVNNLKKRRRLMRNSQTVNYLKEGGLLAKLLTHRNADGETAAHQISEMRGWRGYTVAMSDRVSNLKEIHNVLREDADFNSALSLSVHGISALSAQLRILRQEANDQISLMVRDVHGRTPAHNLADFEGDITDMLDLFVDVGGLQYLWDDICGGSNLLMRAVFSNDAWFGKATYLNFKSKVLWLSGELRSSDYHQDIGYQFEVNLETPLLGACEAFGINPRTGHPEYARDLMIRSIKTVGADTAAGDGLRREWMNRAAKELLDRRRGLFVLGSDGSTLLPNKDARHAAPDYVVHMALLGRIVGLALAHGELVPAVSSLSIAFLKVVFGMKLVADDLAYIDAEAHERVVLYMRECRYLKESMTLADLGTCFSYTEEPNADYATDARKERRIVELFDGGGNVQVTESDKEDYLHLYAHCRLSLWQRDISSHVDAFVGGLSHFITPPIATKMTTCFTPSELVVLIGGVAEFTTSVLQDWRATTQYRGGLSGETPLVRWFWDVVHGLNKADLACLLAFVTGSPRPPPMGFAHLSGFSGATHCFTLQAIDGGPSRLPTAQTCFNTLNIPRLYDSKATLKSRLLVAIHGSSGFSEAAVAQAG